jgi:hypothetical protein
MIQRKQSLYLFIAALFAFTYLFSSPVFCELTSSNASEEVTESLILSYAKTVHKNTDGTLMEVQGSNNYLVWTLIVIGGLSFIAIILFKQRKIQLRLVVYAMVFDFLLLFLLYFQHKIGMNYFEGEAISNWKIFAFLPILLPLLHLLALRGIVNDIKLLQAVDRLR